MLAVRTFGARHLYDPRLYTSSESTSLWWLTPLTHLLGTTTSLSPSKNMPSTETQKRFSINFTLVSQSMASIYYRRLCYSLKPRFSASECKISLESFRNHYGYASAWLQQRRRRLQKWETKAEKRETQLLLKIERHFRLVVSSSSHQCVFSETARKYTLQYQILPNQNNGSSAKEDESADLAELEVDYPLRNRKRTKISMKHGKVSRIGAKKVVQWQPFLSRATKRLLQSLTLWRTL